MALAGNATAARALVDLVGLAGDVAEAPAGTARFVHIEGRVLRAPSLALLLRMGLPRAFLEPLVAKPSSDDEPLLAFLQRRLGRRAGRIVAAAMAAGVYAGDPSALSARTAFPRLGAMAEGSLLFAALRSDRRRIGPLWSLRQGLGALSEAMALLLGNRVRTATPVIALDPIGRGWAVDANDRVESFDGLILAVPATAAARLTRPFAPALARQLAQIRYAPISVVHLGVPESSVPMARKAFGVVDIDGTMNAVGTLFPSSLFPGRAPAGKALLTCLVGGALHPDRALAPDAALIDGVLADLRRTAGLSAEADYVRIVRHAEAIPQVAPGHGRLVDAARKACALLPPLELAGAAYDGVSVSDSIRSGESAAASCASLLNERQLRHFASA